MGLNLNLAILPLLYAYVRERGIAVNWRSIGENRNAVLVPPRLLVRPEIAAGEHRNRQAVNILNESEKRTRLVRELAKIDPKEEKQLAERGLGDRAWPEY